MPRRTLNQAPKTAGEISRERVRTAAARLFARRGFAQSSMRELAREAGMSLAGLYHHFATKDDLLFEIQRDAFDHLFESLRGLPDELTPEEKIAFLIEAHLRVFSTHITEMKALSHEANALSGDLGRRMHQMRRDYYNICLRIVEQLTLARPDYDISPRIATMSLFGMINWIYTWYRPGSDVPAKELARQMTTIFLHGIQQGNKGVTP